MTPPKDATALGEVVDLARSRPRSGREAVAKASALRTWERLSRGRKIPMPPHWHPGPAEFEELDVSDPVERRENWWAALNR